MRKEFDMAQSLFSSQELKSKAHEFVEAHWEEMVKDITTLVKIRSVEDLEHAAPGMPYGPAPFEALQCAVDIAARLGLDAHNLDGHIGYADVVGASPKQIAMIAHTDIVAEGSGWHYEPFEVTRKDGYLIGRGVIDDKGPFILELYCALFFLKWSQETGKQLPYTLRCLIGANEETEMADVEWYLERYPQPEFLFSPDAVFPLICGEKGGYSATITSAKIAEDIINFHGGDAGNAVPSLAEVTVKAHGKTFAPTDRIEVEDLGDGTVKLTAHGIGAHASKPEGSINAIGLLVDYLLAHEVGSPAEKDFLSLLQTVHAATDGSNLGIASQDEYFTPLTCIAGTIRTRDGHFEQTIDSRYPTSITSKDITAKAGALCAEHNATIHVDVDMVPFLTDPESAPMQTLVQTYNEFTGQHDKPFTIGGGTYARHFKAGGAFGPCDPHFPMPDWIGAEHSADEGFSEEQFKRALEIYIVSIGRLMELDF